jgi:C-terminal processing protease CtpA/Prc
MLKTVGDEDRKPYYHPKFHGVDLDMEIVDSKQRIEKVHSMNMALSNIAAALDALDDSHTFFLPPQHHAPRIEHQMRARYLEYGEPLIVMKVPEFEFSPSEVRAMMDKVRRHTALILDLRGNPGGSVETLEYLLGAMFDKDVKIADRVGRKENKPQIAKASHNPSDGKSLEHAGVTPDEIVLPTAADLASGRDPVLSRAADYSG